MTYFLPQKLWTNLLYIVLLHPIKIDLFSLLLFLILTLFLWPLTPYAQQLFIYIFFSIEIQFLKWGYKKVDQFVLQVPTVDIGYALHKLGSRGTEYWRGGCSECGPALLHSSTFTSLLRLKNRTLLPRRLFFNGSSEVAVNVSWSFKMSLFLLVLILNIN